MTIYLDTSSMLKLYIDEPGRAEIVHSVKEAEVVATSMLAYPEACATFARRRRERLMTPTESAAAIRSLDADWAGFLAISLDSQVAKSAGRLAASHRLRGADAVHLASFEVLLANTDDADVTFFSADERLVRAAKSLG